MIPRAAFLVVLLPLVAGCGAREGGKLSDAEGAMAKAGSSRVEIRMDFGKAGGGIKGEGISDYAQDRSEMILRPLSPQFKGSYPADNLFIGRTTYSGWTLLGKKVWLKESDDEPTGFDSYWPGPGGASPDSVLTLLLEKSKKTENLGTDEIRGTEAKHYRVHLDKSKVGGRSLFPKVVEAWVDGDGLVRRLQVPTAPGGPLMTIDFFDFGVSADIHAPNDDELVTQKELNRLIAADCKDRKKKGEPIDESFCTSADVVGGEIGPIETMPRTVTDPK